MMNHMNEAVLRGVIAGINSTKGETNVTITTRDKGILNYPSVLFYPNVDLGGFKIGDTVTVRGFVQNHVTQKANGKKGSKAVFIGEEIHRAKRLLADYFPEEDVPEDILAGFPDDKNEVVFVGDVMRIYVPDPSKSFAIVKVNCVSSKHKGQCDMSCFARISASAKNVNVGDTVAMVGYFTTKNENVNGRQITLMDIVCKDICKLERKEYRTGGKPFYVKNRY